MSTLLQLSSSPSGASYRRASWDFDQAYVSLCRTLLAQVAGCRQKRLEEGRTETSAPTQKHVEVMLERGYSGSCEM